MNDLNMYIFKKKKLEEKVKQVLPPNKIQKLDNDTGLAGQPAFIWRLGTLSKGGHCYF